jgi:hypothetical protein
MAPDAGDVNVAMAAALGAASAIRKALALEPEDYRLWLVQSLVS